jgi:hypothetical protein
MVFPLYCTPSCLPVGRDPAPKGGDRAVLSGQTTKDLKIFIILITKVQELFTKTNRVKSILVKLIDNI